METRSILVLLILVFAGCAIIPPVAQHSEVIRNARRTHYVRADAPANGDGTHARPFTSIQRAIDAAGSDDAVLVLPGTYSENVTLRRRVHLVGTDPDSTVLTCSQGVILTSNTASNLVVEGFTFDGRHEAESALSVDWSGMGSRENLAPLVFRNNVVRNMIGHAIYGYTAMVVVEGCQIEHAQGHGIRFFRVTNEISRNRISNTSAGLDVQDDRTVIQDNMISDCRAHGIRLHNVSGSVVRRNEIRQSGDSGVWCEARAAVSILDNIVIGSKKDGFWCREGAIPVLRRNQLTHNAGYGIHIQDAMPDLGRADDNGYNIIADNQAGDVLSKSPDPIFAVGNWWGGGVPRVTGNVRFEPFLTENPYHSASAER